MTSSQFSCMAPSGIRFTRGPSKAKLYYEQLREMWGSLFTDDPDAAINIETFAQAKCLAIASEQLRRAGNQANPRHVTELISKLEKDYRIVPRPGATIQERRSALISARAAKAGALLTAITTGLTAILGDLLIEVVPQPMGAVGTGGMFPDNVVPDWHSTVPNSGPGTFKPLGATFKTVRLTTHTLSGTAGYVFAAGEDVPLAVGERLTLNPGMTGQTETVDVSTSTASTFTATFTKPHGAGSFATTAAIPIWETGRRFVYVVAAESVFNDAVLLKRVDEYMRKTLGHACGWATVRDTTAGHAGPFVIEESMIGQVPIVEVVH